MSTKPQPSPTPPQKTAKPRRSRWQFGLGTLLLFMCLASLVFFAWSGLLRSRKGTQPIDMVLFIALSLCLPMGVMIATSLYGPIKKWITDWRKQR